MDKKLFDQLAESMEQMREITRGERSPSREFVVDAIEVKAVRAATGLSQFSLIQAAASSSSLPPISPMRMKASVPGSSVKSWAASL